MSSSARVLAADEEAVAERAIRSNYGFGRRLYRWLIGGADARYVEVVPLSRRSGSNA